MCGDGSGRCSFPSNNNKGESETVNSLLIEEAIRLERFF